MLRSNCHQRIGACSILSTALLTAFGLSSWILPFTVVEFASAQEIETSNEILFQKEGNLEVGDATRENGVLYDEYTIEGRAGNIISIALNSSEFDAYLRLTSSDGKILAENDDVVEAEQNRNSWLSFTLPEDAQYKIIATAYSDEKGEGIYTLTVFEGKAEPVWDIDEVLSESNQINISSRSNYGPNGFDGYINTSSKMDEAESLFKFGQRYLHQGQIEYAISYFDQSLHIYHTTNDYDGEVAVLSLLSSTYHRLGEYEKALDFGLAAQQILRQTGIQANEVVVLNSLIDVYRSLGQYQESIELAQQALDIARQREPENEGAALYNLGLTYRYLGQYQQAIELTQQALSTARLTGERSNEGASLGLLYSARLEAGLF